jgi:hypothetical protein
MTSIRNREGRVIGYIDNRGNKTVYLTVGGRVVGYVFENRTFDVGGRFIGYGDLGVMLLDD